MALALIMAPTAKPVTLEEVKRHLRIDTADDDEYLNTLIDASLAHLEAVSGLKLITQTWREFFDCPPRNAVFRLGIWPVQTILEMRIYDASGNFHSIPNSFLDLDHVSSPARLEVTAPVSPAKSMNGIEIDIVAGFGDTSLDIPDNLRRALLLLISHNYEFRGAVPVDQQPASEPHGFRTLIAPFRRIGL